MPTIVDRIRRFVTKMPVAVFLAVGAAAALGACSPSSEPSGVVGKGTAPEATAEIVIADGSFEPETLELAAGEEVTVQVINDDEAPHDFAIEAMDLNTGTIQANKNAYATFTVPQDQVEFVCTFHPGMKGRIEPVGA